MNSRLLPQNKIPFGLDLLAKFIVFAHKCTLEIRILLSRTEGTIVRRLSRGTCWDREQPVRVARDGGTLLGGRGLATRVECATTSAS